MGSDTRSRGRCEDRQTDDMHSDNGVREIWRRSWRSWRSRKRRKQEDRDATDYIYKQRQREKHGWCGNTQVEKRRHDGRGVDYIDTGERERVERT